MRTTILSVMLTISSFYSFSQEPILLAAKNSETNQDGDPINNIIDADGARQGAWYFLDSHGNEVFMNSYVNNMLDKSYYALNGNWIEVQVLTDQQMEEQIADEIELYLSQQGIVLTASQQIMLVLGSDGSLVVSSTLGNWQGQQSLNALESIATYFETTQYAIQYETVILL